MERTERGREGEREGEGGRKMGRGREQHFFLKLGYIILSLGRTRNFFRKTNQLPKLPKLLRACIWWVYLPPNWFLSRLEWQACMIKHLPYTILTCTAHVLIFPHSVLGKWWWDWKDGPSYLYGGGLLIPFAGQCSSPLGSMWNCNFLVEQAHAPQLIMINNVWFPLLLSLLISSCLC